MCQRSVSIIVMEAYVVGHPNNELVNVNNCIAGCKFTIMHCYSKVWKCVRVMCVRVISQIRQALFA